MASDDIAADIVRRITDAADQLFDEGGKSTFPNVDAVRRRAHANMNHVTLVMRTWREQHQPHSPSADEALPDALRQQSDALLGSFWRAARAIARADLEIALTAWNAEKAEQEELRSQLAAAFDAQSVELHQATASRAKIHEELIALAAAKNALEHRVIHAEAESTANARALGQAQSEITELHKLLGAVQSASDHLGRQLYEQETRHTAIAERNLAEQTRYAEQLGQARQEATELRARLSEASLLPPPARPLAA